jgi:hypothetical protein
MDTRDFDVEFSRVIEKTIPSATNRGLVKAAWEALRDAEKKEPTVPAKEFHLRGSKEVHGSKDLFALFVEFGFNIIYAARMHELPGRSYKNPTTPGSGPKFLETKLIKYKDDYMEIVALSISKEQGQV